MIVEWTLEEELQIEAQARSVLTHNDPDAVRDLCASLIKQHAYHSRLLRQATGHIAEIELSALLGCEHQPEATDSAVASLAYPTARNAKGFGYFLLRLFGAIKSVIRRDNIPIPFV